METRFLPGQNYDCVRCAKGCREEWRIYADPHTDRKIAESSLAARRMEETGLTGVFDKHPENGSNIMKRHDGGCIFLQADNRCGVHAQLGVTCKPIGCRLFPFLPVNTPDGLFIGITFYCTAAKRNQGRPMDAHVWTLKELLPFQRLYTAGFERQKLTPRSTATMAWPVYRRFEEHVTGGGIARALWAIAVLSAGVSGDVTATALEDAWTAAEPDRLTSDDILRAHEQFFVDTLLITLELPQADTRKAAIQTWQAGGEVALTQSGWTGASTALAPFLANMPAWVEEEMSRYRKALIFRKFLALHRPLLANAATLYIMPRLFHVYAAVWAAKRSATIVEREDVEYAFDRLELFLTHTTNPALDRLLGEFADGYSLQIEVIPKTVPS